MHDLPLTLRLRGKRALVVGGGATALRRVRSLLECGARVMVVAPEVQPQIQATGAEIRRRAYRPGDAQGAAIVVIATDNPAVNEQVQLDARASGALINRCDAPEKGDVCVMAHARRGPVTVAVATEGISARAAAGIRDQLLQSLDDRWVTLLQTVAPFRDELQRRCTDSGVRQQALARLTDEGAWAAMEQGVEKLREHCRAILADGGLS